MSEAFQSKKRFMGIREYIYELDYNSKYRRETSVARKDEMLRAALHRIEIIEMRIDAVLKNYSAKKIGGMEI